MSAVCKSIQPDQLAELSSSAKGTFSTDMSSKKWLSQHMPSEKKKELSSVPESSRLASAEGSNKEPEREGQFDMWGAIMSQKKIDSCSTPTPYVLPLVKRSASLLSEKSLQICTESLGSETGSDSLSSSDNLDCSPCQESEDEEEEIKENEEERESQDVKKELGAESKNCPIRQKLVAHSFPPPLPSLSSHDGPCVYMRSHCKDGRLVLQAVKTPSQNYFHAQRQGGRLLLTFITSLSEGKQEITENSNGGEEDKEEEFSGLESQVKFKQVEEEDETEFKIEEEEEEEKGIELQQVQITQDERASQAMTVHRSNSFLNKRVGGKPFENPNPWDGKSRKKREEGKPFNAYDCWLKSNEHPLHVPPNKILPLKAQDSLLLLRCKPRRPLLAPRCIATS